MFRTDKVEGRPDTVILYSSVNLFFIKIFTMLVPRILHPPFAFVTAGLFYLLLGEERRGVRGNLQVVTGGRRVERLVFSTFYKFARNWTDILLLMRMPVSGANRLIARTAGGDQLDAALQAGGGAILVSPHLGNWELGGFFLAQKGLRLNVLTFREPDERVNAARERARAGQGINFIYVDRNDTSPLAAVEAVNALRRNEVVVLLGDRDGSSQTKEVEFFGKKVAVPLGPAYLSLVTGAPVIPVFVVLEKGQYAAVMEDPIVFQGDRGNRQQIIDLGMKRLMEVFEEYIRRYPDQWYNFFDYWKQSERNRDVRAAD